MSGLFPAYILREVTNDGKPLSGGLIYSFQSGTMTPKPLYADAGLTTALSNPVELDTSGSAVMFMADGAYRIWVKDSLGIPVQPFLDGIVASGSGGAAPGTNATFALVKLYADLRALTVFPDAVYVSGRLAEGDGGQGWFQLIPGSSATDDGGVVLTAASGSKVYRRVFDAAIDPQWFGVAYGVSSNQHTTLRTALSASAAQNAPVQVAGSVYLTQSVTVNAGESARFTEDGFLTSGVATQAIFAAGSHLEAEGRTFGAGVSPIIATEACPQIRLSWMGGVTGDDRIAKLAGASAKGVALIDSDATTGSSATFPVGLTVSPAGGTITISGPCNFIIPTVNQNYQAPWISTVSNSAAGGVVVGGMSGARPVWFSGAGAATAAITSGFLRISSGDLVSLARNVALTDLRVVGDGCDSTAHGIEIQAGFSLAVAGRFSADGVLLSAISGGITCAAWEINACNVLGTGPWGYCTTITEYNGESSRSKNIATGLGVIDLSPSAVIANPFQIDSPYGGIPNAKINASSAHGVFAPTAVNRTIQLCEPGGDLAGYRFGGEQLIVDLTAFPGGLVTPVQIFVGEDSGAGSRISKMNDHTSHAVDIVLCNCTILAGCLVDFVGYTSHALSTYTRTIFIPQYSSCVVRAIVFKEASINPDRLMGVSSVITTDSIFHS